jgi:hypothetical protein
MRAVSPVESLRPATFVASRSSSSIPGGDTFGQWYASTGIVPAAATTSP